MADPAEWSAKLTGIARSIVKEIRGSEHPPMYLVLWVKAILGLLLDQKEAEIEEKQPKS